MRRRGIVAALCALPLAAAGCGNSRTPVLDTTVPAAPHAFHTLSYGGSAAVTVAVPKNWISTRSKAPLIGTIRSGPATIALWRYQRAQPVAMDPASLAHALKALEDAARTRDPELHVIRAAVTKADGRPAVEFDVIERIGAEVRRVRSVHVYNGATEVVLEEMAPPSLFHAVDHTVFSPVRRSLHLPPAA